MLLGTWRECFSFFWTCMVCMFDCFRAATAWLHRRFPPEKSAKKIVFFHRNFAMGLSQWVLGVG